MIAGRCSRRCDINDKNFFFGDLFVWSDGPASFMLVVIYFFIIIFFLLLLFIETDATRRRGVIVGCMVAC